MTAQIQIPQLWDLSCRDWQTRIRNRQSIIPDLPLFTSEADMAVAIFDNLRLPDVVGEPLLRDAVRDWFRQIVRAVFGSRDPKTNQRFIREMLAMVPKGQAKTTYCAALLVVAMVMNLRPRAEMMFVGETQSVADFAYDQAVGMVQADPELKRRFRPVPHKKEIKDLFNGAKLKVKTFDLSILTGSKPVFVLLDELHLLGKNHHAAKVIRQIRGGLEKNPEGFLIMTTTQSDEAPTGVFKDELILARKIRDGEFQGRMLPVLYEFPKDIAADPEQWQNPDNWSMVMPNLGISIQPDSLLQDWKAEQTKGPHAIQVWASQHLNLQIGVSQNANNWPGARHWDKNANPLVTFDHIIEHAEIITIGIDGGGLDDMLGLAVIGRHKITRDWMHWGHAWLHEDVLNLRKSEASKFRDLEAAGDLTIVAKISTAFTQIADIAEQINETALLAKIGLDPVGVKLIVDELARRGITQEGGQVEGVSQGYKLQGTIKSVEGMLSDGTFCHSGQALMQYAVANCKVEQKSNTSLITKQASGTAKIDPAMAMFDAAALMLNSPEISASVYSAERGLVVFG